MISLTLNDYLTSRTTVFLVELMGVQADKKLRLLQGMYIISFHSIS